MPALEPVCAAPACDNPLPEDARSDREYCSDRCSRRRYYVNHREAELERKRKHHASYREAELERNRKYRADNREALAESRRRRHEENPHKQVARAAVRQALRSGAMVAEPCLFCGAANVEAHHHDYALPLGVTWLCPAHHSLAHRVVLA